MKFRKQAIDEAKRIIELNPLFLDTETTGLDRTSEIVEIAILDINSNVIYETLVKPVRKLSDEATSIHKITNEMLGNSPVFSQIMPALANILKNRDVVIYNKDYDLKLLKQSAEAQNEKWSNDIFNAHCAMNLYSKFACEYSHRGTLKWHKLVNACKSFDYSCKNAHRAKDDCLMTIFLLKSIAESTF